MAKYNVGDRVRIVNDALYSKSAPAGSEGRVGTVVENDRSSLWPYRVQVDGFGLLQTWPVSEDEIEPAGDETPASDESAFETFVTEVEDAVLEFVADVASLAKGEIATRVPRWLRQAADRVEAL